MYYSGVNRGMLFTKAGKYTLTAVVVMGLFAIITGLNAFFIFLSFGLGALIASGVLSERQIKGVQLKSGPRLFLEAGQPSGFPVTVINPFRHVDMFGLRIYLRDDPKKSFYKKFLGTEAWGHASYIAATSDATCDARPRAFSRGRKSGMPVLISTAFPFGLVEKFKMTQWRQDIVVHPSYDQALGQSLRPLLDTWRREQTERHEFHNHRAYQSRDTLRQVDWKRQARTPESQWLVKVFHHQGQTQPVEVLIPLESLLNAASDAHYERWLQVIWTTFETLRQARLDVSVRLPSQGKITDAESVQVYLAEFPTFAERHSLAAAAQPETHDYNNILRIDLSVLMNRLGQEVA